MFLTSLQSLKKFLAKFRKPVERKSPSPQSEVNPAPVVLMVEAQNAPLRRAEPTNERKFITHTRKPPGYQKITDRMMFGPGVKVPLCVEDILEHRDELTDEEYKAYIRMIKYRTGCLRKNPNSVDILDRWCFDTGSITHFGPTPETVWASYCARLRQHYQPYPSFRFTPPI